VDSERLLTVPEVAERLRLHPDTVRRWLREGRMHGVMMGGRAGGYRVRESEVERVAAEGPSPEAAPGQLMAAGAA
jgi:excisionase family DNA binding protein